MGNVVYIVHCVDTEGPLYESIDATFGRLRNCFDIDLKPDVYTLKKLQNKEIDLDGKEDAVANVVREDFLKYNDTWDKMYRMFDVLNNKTFRNAIQDSFGGTYRMNWFVLDHVHHVKNPRRRTLGFGAIFEEYIRMLNMYDLRQDALYLHFHPLSFGQEANTAGMNISFSNVLNEIVARRIIDYGWFPAAFRPTNTEYMDLSNWLEQWIPFDFANNNKEKDNRMESEIAAGRFPYRFIDWRGAPVDWSIYHPSIWDARKAGNLKRYIARCLLLNGRHSILDEYEIERAFAAAKSGKDVLVSFAHHDFRDMVEETSELREMVLAVSKRYKNVRFQWSNAVDAFRRVMRLAKKEPVKLSVRQNGRSITVESSGDIWGPQPFLAIETKEKKYYHDNLIHTGMNRWAYVFDDETVPLESVKRVGVATNDDYGNTCVLVTEENDLNRFVTKIWNHTETGEFGES